MKKKSENKKINVIENNDKHINIIYTQIASVIKEARAKVMLTIDTTMVQAYWHIGKYIVEEEQRGKTRANYGTYLIEELSSRLNNEFGQGFGIATLENARKFYVVYGLEKPYALRRESGELQLSHNLSWTHYRALMRESRQTVRLFYEVEAIKNCWSGRELERQMGSLLFERLAKSKDKKGLMKLSCKGQEITKPEDAIKEPFVLEFLNRFLPANINLICQLKKS